MKVIVIFGSARSFGNTRKAIDQIFTRFSIKIIDLNNLNIGHYDYKYCNQSDDFIPLMEEVVKYDLIILATPIYWYNVSARMKIFIDRWSDLVRIKQDLKYKLHNKSLFIVTTLASDIKPSGFEDIFQQICKYLNMQYLGTSFIRSDDNGIISSYKNDYEINKVLDITQQYL